MLPKIELANAAAKTDALVLGWHQPETKDKSKDRSKEKDAEKPKGYSEPVYKGKRTKEIDSLVERLRQSKHFFGKKTETSLLRYYSLDGYPNTLLLGMGAPSRWNLEICRQSGAAVFLAQKRERLSQVTVQSDSVFYSGTPKEQKGFVEAFAEGYLLASYDYRDLKKQDPDVFAPAGLSLIGPKGIEENLKRAQVLAESVNLARSLGDRPGNILTPTELARILEETAKQVGLKCRVLGREEIEKEKMGLFLGVSQGSVQEPKFIILEHRGANKGDRPVVLIGKGITFDSGGISLKPALRMEDMKYDMMGAAAVAGIMKAVAQLKLPVNIVGMVAATENMPGGRAQKPGDVQRSMTGRTVEIINTDAEGRLILADALEYAQKYFEPQAIIDFATLTGAVVDALGTVCSGIMGTHQGLIQRIKDASSVSGERVWELPLYEEYEEDLRSNVADIKNSGIREAGSSKGGTFLKFFVDAKYPWVHCDIAGAAYHRKDVNYHPQKFGSGVMVRLMTRMLESWRTLK